MKIKTSTKRRKPKVVKAIGTSSTDFTRSETNERMSIMKLLAEASKSHPYTFATVDSVSRSIVGAGWKFLPVEGHESEATQESLEPIQAFFEQEVRDWNNIGDYLSASDKFTQMFNSFRLFGHAACEITRTNKGEPIGYDVLSGITFPNLSEKGYFESPNFHFYPWGDGDKVGYSRDELIYLWNPGITGNVGGESLYESLSANTLPSDIYAAVAFRELFKNTNAPYNGVWEIDSTVSDEDFDYFVELLEQRYSGAENFGRNPLVVRGVINWKEISSRSEDDAPYLEGRNFSREEFYAATGVDGNKLGTTDTANKSNIRESRREFHENTLRPLTKRVEENLYEQVMVRLFHTRGWALKFTKPDITTAMEQAAIDMRYMQWGVFSPNEIRVERGFDPREGGDIYYVPLNMAQIEEDGTFRKPADMDDDDGGGGDSGNDDDDDDTGGDDTRPPRDDENPDSTKDLDELRTWRKYHLRMLDGKKPRREFTCDHINQGLSDFIKKSLDKAQDDFSEVKAIFDIAEEIIRGAEYEEEQTLAVS